MNNKMPEVAKILGKELGVVMMNNKMEEVAKILGKELEEEFEIEGRIGKNKLTEKGLLYKNLGDWRIDGVETLTKLLTGKLKIEWIPKDGEEIWLVSSEYEAPQSIDFDSHIYSYYVIGLKRGLIFRTEEEAITKMKELGWL